MKRFKNILYFADGALEDNPALNRAYDLAVRNDARLTVVDVIDDYESDPELEKRLGKPVSQLIKENHQTALSAIVESYQSSDQVIYTDVLIGTAFMEIIRAVLRNNHDLVIKAAHPSPGLADRLLGSTDMHLLRKCPCPVWIDRPGKPVPYQSVLAAVDPYNDSDISRLIMDLATSLAQRNNAQLSVLHSWRLPGETMLRSGRSRISSSEVDLLLEHKKQAHESAFNSILESYSLSTEHEEVHMVCGNTTETIIDHSRDADVIVMGTVGRTGIQGLIIGNTAEEVMQNTSSSILAVKPHDFASPVS